VASAITPLSGRRSSPSLAVAGQQEMVMSDPVDALVLDLLEWVGRGERPYREVIEAWRTSCPRLPVWETANSQGLLEHRHHASRETSVAVSARGIELLRSSRAAPAGSSRQVTRTAG